MSVSETTDSLSADFEQLPKNMRIFSLCLKSLYTENNVASSASNATSINDIRDRTREDAIVYVKGVLPRSTQVVRCIQEFFEYYEELNVDEWKAFLPNILQEVTGYQQCCKQIAKMHEEILIPLKKRQDEAKVVISELTSLNKQLLKKKAMLENEASFLRIIPIVGEYAGKFLDGCAESGMAKAEEGGQQVNLNEAAIVVVSDALVPALSAFIEGLHGVAGFFSLVKEELTTFQSKGEKAAKNTELHYIMMRKKSLEMKIICRRFYAMIPGVRTDLQCIPDKPNDQNRVNKWLIRQQKRIQEEYPQQHTTHLKNMLEM